MIIERNLFYRMVTDALKPIKQGYDILTYHSLKIIVKLNNISLLALHALKRGL
jgi:hypothetical protein